MKHQQKVLKIFFLLFFFSFSAYQSELEAQNISTFYVFPADVQDIRGFDIDAAGNFYLFNYDQNWNGRFSKLSANGTLSTIAPAQYYYPENLKVDHAGNIYFTDMMGMGAGLQKLTPEGIMSDFLPLNYMIRKFTFDDMDNIYFANNNWPPNISKATPEGIISTYFAEPNVQPQDLAIDQSGNLYFFDTYNPQVQLKKLTPEGTISVISSGNYYTDNLEVDEAGNIYFIDQGIWPNDIKKIAPDGTVTILSNPALLSYPRSLIIDKSGNIYFIDYFDNRYTIKMIQNLESPCPEIPQPVTNDTSVCHGSSILLSASGFGELRWYDAPIGGNLLNIGSNYMAGPLTTNSSFYIESFICNTSTARTELKVAVYPPPTIVISGNTSGADSVVLTASGGISYLWSGGNSTRTAQNSFILSGTYHVTVTNEGGCTNTASASVTVIIPGLNKFGNTISDRISNINENGATGALTKVDRNGKIRVQGLDGLYPENAAASALEIKQNFPNSPDGYYWIKNSNINAGIAFKIYADMTTDGGGWTLIMCNASNSGWNYNNAISLNPTAPSINSNYSIIGWADYIKKSNSGFQYMIDAHTRKSNGGIWTANGDYTFVKNNNSQTDITLDTKFGTWNYNDSGLEKRMPWYSNCSGFITTSQICNGGAWWGTLIAESGWSPAPWISAGCGVEGCMTNPGIIWYWVR